MDDWIDRIAQAILDVETKGDWSKPYLSDLENSDHYREMAKAAIGAIFMSEKP